MRKSFCLLPLAAALLLSGCVNLAPDYERPTAPVPAAWPQDEATQSAQLLTDGLALWGDFFTDARLRELIRLGLINNRDLRTLRTDVSRTRELAGAVGGNAVRVAESGLRSHADAFACAPFADAFLVGTSLMRERDLDRACRALIFGENKVCGLTRPEDARAALEAGAVFGGLIFAEDSPRKISPERAEEIVAETPGLDFVCVFRDAGVDEIADTATRLHPAAVQLHGNADAAFAARLRERLPRGVRIWKAVPADAEFPRGLFGETVFDRFVLDSGRGGTGTTFPWEKIPPEAKLRALLAGGLSPENARAAHRVGCVGLDFNSGVENAPGEKSAEKIRAAFAEIRKF